MIRMFFLLGFVGMMLIASTKADVIVEPFLASWCASQFPNQQLGGSSSSFSGYNMRTVMDTHVKIEPYLGLWCFDQFSQLDTTLDKDAAIAQLYTDHEQIEESFLDWGNESLMRSGGDDLVDVEPYVAQWCVNQYPLQLKTEKGPHFIEAIQANHVKLEPALGRWCFAQFPAQLSSLEEEETVRALGTQHELVENELMRWVLANHHGGPRGKANKGLVAGLIIMSVAFVSVLLALIVTRRTVKQLQAASLSSSEDVEEELELGLAPSTVL